MLPIADVTNFQATKNKINQTANICMLVIHHYLRQTLLLSLLECDIAVFYCELSFVAYYITGNGLIYCLLYSPYHYRSSREIDDNSYFYYVAKQIIKEN